MYEYGPTQLEPTIQYDEVDGYSCICYPVGVPENERDDFRKVPNVIHFHECGLS